MSEDGGGGDAGGGSGGGDGGGGDFELVEMAGDVLDAIGSVSCWFWILCLCVTILGIVIWAAG